MRFHWVLLMVLGLVACQEKRDELHRSWRVMKVTVVDSTRFQAAVQNKADSIVDAYLRLYPDEQYALLYKNGKYVAQKWIYDYKTERITLVGNTPYEEISLRKTDAGDDWVQFEWIRQEQNAARLPGFVIRLLCTENTKYEHEGTDILNPEQNRWRNKPASAQSDEQIRRKLVAQLTFCIDYFQLIEKKEQGYFETALLQSPFRFYRHGLGIAASDDLPERWTSIFHNEADARKAQRMLTDALQSSGDYPKAETFVEEYRKVLEKMRLYLDK